MRAAGRAEEECEETDDEERVEELLSQDHPVSMVQVAEQPSPASTLSSSQVSVPLLRPSPQTAAQMLGDPVHRKPTSTVQEGE